MRIDEQEFVATKDEQAKRAYVRILKAAKKGHGCTLSHAECIAISFDDAVATAANDYVERQRALKPQSSKGA